MSRAFHVTHKETAPSIMEDGFLGSWGDAGYGVYLFDSVEAAEEYQAAGGWNGETDPSNFVIIEVAFRPGEADYVKPDPSWQNQEDYAHILYHVIEDDSDEAWRPIRSIRGEVKKGSLMRLSDFIATEERHDPAVAADILGVGRAQFPEGCHVWIYDGGPHLIEEADGTYTCYIFSDEQSFDNREDAAGYLYTEFFMTECAGDPFEDMFREEDGTLDAVIADVMKARPDLFPEGADWGDIMGVMFSNTEIEAYSTKMVYTIMATAARIYAPVEESEPSF